MRNICSKRIGGVGCEYAQEVLPQDLGDSFVGETSGDQTHSVERPVDPRQRTDGIFARFEYRMGVLFPDAPPAVTGEFGVGIVGKRLAVPVVAVLQVGTDLNVIVANEFDDVFDGMMV